MRSPYDLRHAGVTRRLNEGVDEATVAAWAGHSVEVLRRIYHHSIGGQDEVLIARMDPPEAVVMGTHRGRNTAPSGIARRLLAPAQLASSQVRGR